MTIRVPRERRRKPLGAKIDRQLLAYTAAATAAGIGLMAFPPKAEAKIVYTPANVALPPNTVVGFDLNKDGLADFAILVSTYGSNLRYHRENVIVDPAKFGDAIWSVFSGTSCAAALPRGAKIGSGANFLARSMLIWQFVEFTSTAGRSFCKWGGLKRGAYLGLKIIVHGQNYYGWAHVTLGNKSGVLDGYAYETIPNQPIFAGMTKGPEESAPVEPIAFSQPKAATLGALALGWHGLSLWRKEEQEPGQ